MSTIETRLSWDARVAEWNADRFAAQKTRRRQSITPEYSFAHHFDNSRLVKVVDPVRARQIRVFMAATVVLFSLMMVYGLQHFKAIEIGYSVEAEKQYLGQLKEENRQLALQASQLSNMARLDDFARKNGLAEPRPGQVISSTVLDVNAPTLAKVDGLPAGGQ